MRRSARLNIWQAWLQVVCMRIRPSAVHICSFSCCIAVLADCIQKSLQSAQCKQRLQARVVESQCQEHVIWLLSLSRPTYRPHLMATWWPGHAMHARPSSQTSACARTYVPLWNQDFVIVSMQQPSPSRCVSLKCGGPAMEASLPCCCAMSDPTQLIGL